MKNRKRYCIHVTWLDNAEVVETTDPTEEFNAMNNKYALKTVCLQTEGNRMWKCLNTCDLYSLRWYTCCVHIQGNRKSYKESLELNKKVKKGNQLII